MLVMHIEQRIEGLRTATTALLIVYRQYGLRYLQSGPCTQFAIQPNLALPRRGVRTSVFLQTENKQNGICRNLNVLLANQRPPRISSLVQLAEGRY